MRAYRETLGILGIVGILGTLGGLAFVGCTGSLPKNGAGTGGAGAVAQTGTGGVGALALTGTEGAAGLALTGTGGTGGLATTGFGGAIGGAAGSTTAPGGSTGRSTVPDSHRASATACTVEPEAGVWNASYDGGPSNSTSNGVSSGPTALDGGIITCASDTDCPPCQNGQPDRCHAVPQTLHGPWCICDQCNTDQDCGAGSVCVCNQRGWSSGSYQNACVPAQCQVDADCGPGGFCSPSPGPCGAIQGYYCHTAADPCWSSADCPAGNVCLRSSATGAWGCGTVLCGG
jgi:hypothetical protein